MLERGLVQVYTGDGKGKTSAGVGQAVRALGRGLRVAFVQFVKGGLESGELEPLRRLGAQVSRPAVRNTGLLSGGAHSEDMRAAHDAWGIAAQAIASGEFDLVVCDELAVALAHELVDLDAALEALAARPSHTEVVITGRGAPQALREAADYVTEMRAVKHPYAEGIGPRRGIEY